jgi:hypothetical protein
MASEEELKRLAADAAEVTRQTKEWLDAAKGVNEAIPFVQKTMHASELLRTVFAKTPVTFDAGHYPQIRTDLLEAQRLFGSDQFRLPANVVACAVTGSAALSSASNIVMTDISYASMKGDTAIQTWATAVLPDLQKLQSEESNAAFIQRKLRSLYPGSEGEFDQSLADYHKCRAGAAPATAAGASMRNVLESLNGNLLQLARKLEPKAKIKNWADMASVVARGAPGSAQVGQLLAQKTIYDDLHDAQLTPILKNDLQPSGAAWESIHSQYLGFLYTVLGLVDFRDGK